jgi:hypothetical protein
MIVYFVLAVFCCWLILLSWLLYKTRQHYFNLIKGTKKEKIDEILEVLLNTDKKMESEVEQIKKELKIEIQQSKLHIQKIGIIRFNPFERMGGEQSFVIAFLNNEDNGLVINYIYTRDGLRVYSKKVKKGKGEEYELSEEEKKALEKSN